MIYSMKCKSCNYEIEWSCSIKDYEHKNRDCPKCSSGKLEQDYSKKTANFTINGYSSANNYGLKKE